MAFTTDPATTIERFETLHRYMDSHVLRGDDFICHHFQECRSSALNVRSGRRRQYSEGQLSHVGNHYELAEDGVPLRILVIAMETGGTDAKVSLQTRRSHLHASSEKPYWRRNPHMRGTVSALRVVVGREPGFDSDGEWLDVENERVHLFDAYAMANMRLCSATVAGTTTSRATATMTRNCLEHLIQTVRILEPNLCIVQGLPVGNALQAVQTDVKRVSPNLSTGCLGGHETLIAAFTHPSAPPKVHHWGRLTEVPYLEDVVVPTLQQARHLLLAG